MADLDKDNYQSTERRAKPVPVWSFFWQMLTSPEQLFNKTVRFHPQPYVYLSILLFGIGQVLNQQLIAGQWVFKALEGLDLGWLKSIGLGLFSGFFWYYLGGAWFNLRIKICGGSSDLRTGRLIFIYTLLPLALFHILFYAAGTVPWGRMFIAWPETSTYYVPYRLLGAVMYIFLAIISCIISYRSMAAVFKPQKPKWAVFWFIIIPVTGYLTVTATLINIALDFR